MRQSNSREMCKEIIVLSTRLDSSADFLWNDGERRAAPAPAGLLVNDVEKRYDICI